MVAFAATVMLLGTGARLGLLLVRVTIAPLAGAGALKVIVPVDEDPPKTDVGFSDKELSTGGVTVRAAFLVSAL